MNCPNCGSQLYSKYRDGGSTLICHKCKYEIPNPDWPGNKPMEKLSATITLNEEDVIRIITEYFGKRPIEIGKVTINTELEYVRGHTGGTPHFKSITVETKI